MDGDGEDRRPRRPDGSVVVSERKYSFKLLDDREVEHVRRVTRRTGGQRHKDFEFRLRGGTPTTLAEIATLLPLYGVDRIDTERHDSVIVVEGIPAAEALWGMGFAAVGTMTGALHTPVHQALIPLTGFHHVYLWPDNDAVGVRHMERIAHRLDSLGTKSIKVIRWSGPRKADAADFPDGRSGVEALMARAHPWKRATTRRGRGQLAINLPRVPVRLEPARGAQPPDRSAYPTPRERRQRKVPVRIVRP